MKVEIDHVGIAVNNLAESLEFYCGLLGFPLGSRETVVGEKVNVAMLPANSPTANIELLEATSPDSPVARSIDKRGPGLHHIAFRVDDLRGAIERLRNAGCQLLGDPAIGAGGHRYVFVHPKSAGGVLLELIEWKS